jgi:hypothetical protein
MQQKALGDFNFPFFRFGMLAVKNRNVADNSDNFAFCGFRNFRGNF